MTILDILNQHQGLLIGSALLLGMLVGSFLNVVIYRVPVMLENAWRSEYQSLFADEPQTNCDSEVLAENHPGAEQTKQPFNLVTPGSRCPKCETAIKPWQNIPVISWLWLRGKCAHCSTPIATRYPLVEAFTGLLSAATAWHFFGDLNTVILALCFTWTLIALTGIDYDTYLLPDNITLPLIWAGLVVNYFGVFTTLENAVLGAVCGYLSLWSVFWLFKLLTGKDGMGYGDFKLLAAIGAWLGWQLLPVVIILSSLVGAAIGVALIVISGRDKAKPIPFGPYLAAAGWLALVSGQQLNDAYLNTMGLT